MKTRERIIPPGPFRCFISLPRTLLCATQHDYALLYHSYDSYTFNSVRSKLPVNNSCSECILLILTGPRSHGLHRYYHNA